MIARLLRRDAPGDVECFQCLGAVTVQEPRPAQVDVVVSYSGAHGSRGSGLLALRATAVAPSRISTAAATEWMCTFGVQNAVSY